MHHWPTCLFYFGLLAQLVERCTGIAEVMGSNPVRAWNFFQVLFTTTRFSSVHSCEDLLISSFHRSANMWVIFSWEISASNKLNFSLNGHLWFEGAFRSTQLDIELSFCDKWFFLRSNQAKTPWMDRLFILNFLAFVSQISKFSIHACVVNNEFMCQIKNSILLHLLWQANCSNIQY